MPVPTLATHWALGHIDWSVAIPFALGLIPASMLSARFAQQVKAEHARAAFGVMLVLFATWFLFRQLG